MQGITPKFKTVEVGEKLNIICPCSGTTLWTFNEGMLPTNVHYIGRHIAIEDVTHHNEGIYECECFTNLISGPQDSNFISKISIIIRGQSTSCNFWEPIINIMHSKYIVSHNRTASAAVSQNYEIHKKFSN